VQGEKNGMTATQIYLKEGTKQEKWEGKEGMMGVGGHLREDEPKSNWKEWKGKLGDLQKF
jgi:hypothetical protein